MVAVSPIVGGAALKGPAATMLEQLGYPVSPVSVAGLYADFLDIFVLDQRDEGLRGEIEALGLEVRILDTVMRTSRDKLELARSILEFS